MNYLVTLNINNHLFDNARKSMMAASERWGCKFVELTENLVGDQNVCFNKLVGIQKLANQEEVDGVLYVDSDVLIRNDTPNPFVLFSDKRMVYAAKDVYLEYTTQVLTTLYKPDVIDPWLTKVHDMLHLTDQFSLLYETCFEWFFNAGVFLCYPNEIHSEINSFIENIPATQVSGRIEQAMWNYILKCRGKVTLIGQEWNRLNPNISSGKMNSYVYHFTGFDWKPLKKAILIYDWTI